MLAANICTAAPRPGAQRYVRHQSCAALVLLAEHQRQSKMLRSSLEQLPQQLPLG